MSFSWPLIMKYPPHSCSCSEFSTSCRGPILAKWQRFDYNRLAHFHTSLINNILTKLIVAVLANTLFSNHKCTTLHLIGYRKTKLRPPYKAYGFSGPKNKQTNTHLYHNRYVAHVLQKELLATAVERPADLDGQLSPVGGSPLPAFGGQYFVVLHPHRSRRKQGTAYAGFLDLKCHAVVIGHGKFYRGHVSDYVA